MDEGTVDGAATGATSSGTAAPVRCGCSRECLKNISRHKIEANRLNMCELEKGEKEILVLGLMDSERFSGEHTTKKTKRKHAAFEFSLEGLVVCVLEHSGVSTIWAHENTGVCKCTCWRMG